MNSPRFPLPIAEGSWGEGALPLLAVNNIEAIYDHVILVLRGVSLSVARGRYRRAPRRQWCRQNYDTEGDLQACCPRGTRRCYQGQHRIQRRSGSIGLLAAGCCSRRGLIQVMEGRHCFSHLTVEENC